MFVVCERAVTMIDPVIGKIRGYIARWSDSSHRDSYGTFFDRTRPPEMALDRGMHRRPISYEHAQNGVVQKEIVGVIDEVFFDDTGIGFEGSLDRSGAFFDRIISEIRSALLKTSSATMPHTADFYDDGAFKTWWLGELALTQNPAEELMPAVALVRAGAKGLPSAIRDGNEPFVSTTPTQGGTALVDIQQLLDALANGQITIQDLIGAIGPDQVTAALQQMQQPSTDPTTMSAPTAPVAPALPTQLSAEQATALLTAILRGQTASVQAPPADGGSVPPNAAIAELQRQIAEVRSAQQRQIAAPPVEPPIHRSGGGGQISVGEPRKFDGRSLTDLMFGYQVLRSTGRPISQEYINVLAARAARDVELNGEKSTLSDSYVRAKTAPGASFKRANEIATSTATGGGDEWVAAGWSTEIWQKARLNRIFDEIQRRGMRVEEIPDGQESIDIYTEGSDPTVYARGQQTDLDATGRPTVNALPTRISTGKVVLTPGELVMAVVWNDRFDEDSVIRVLPQYSKQINEKAEETIEQLFLNGDTVTTASTNINLIDATPGTGTSTPYYIASNGALKYALVTGSGTKRDAGSLDESDFRLLLKLFPKAIRTRKAKMVFVTDSDTLNTALAIPAFSTDDVRHTQATITSGVLTNAYGVDLLESGFMELADANGKVNAAVSGTQGRMVGIYAPFWAMGWKRHIEVEQGRDVLAGANLIVATLRLGFLPRGAGASVANYNITIQ